MSDVDCTYTGTDRRKPCPALKTVAEKAAQEAVKMVFAEFGFNIEDPAQKKKLIVIFDSIEKDMANREKGKTAVMIAVSVSAVLGGLGMIAAKFYKD